MMAQVPVARVEEPCAWQPRIHFNANRNGKSKGFNGELLELLELKVLNGELLELLEY
jgi:hypothetical protein